MKNKRLERKSKIKNDPSEVGKKMLPYGIKHGKATTYTHYFCRCNECKKARALYRKENKK